MPSFTSSFKVKYAFSFQRFADFSCIFNMKAYSECIKQHAFSCHSLIDACDFDILKDGTH